MGTIPQFSLKFTTMSDTRGKALIEKSRSKKQPFKLSFIGENGEPLSSAELFTTKWNAQKNIDAHLQFFGAAYVWILDLSGKTQLLYQRWNPENKRRAKLD